MAKDVITRFKLETTQYDSKLKTAARELADFGKTAKSSGRDFNDFTRKQVEAARGIGSMATATTNAKQKAKELVGAFNDLARSYNQLTDAQKQSDFGKAMSSSLTQLQQRIRQTKQEMQGMGNASGGGLFGGDKISGMLQVFGGNLMTKAAGWAASFASEMGQAVQQGIELARQGEGIRIAFERLGRGDLLAGLREATHGTVTDLELMKAAVKFNDFKLPLDELGTMLAFAQQKAKDTGQSVDYMVDSIVTGLGRKSLMILDNLGLSAAQIKDKMAETGDMTKAVGEIIREQMAKAGDYVETAADRATKADVDLKNAMEDLGRTFQPLTDSATSMWTSIKVSALDLLNSAVRPLIDALTTAGRLRKELANMNGGGNGQPSFVDRQISALAGSNYKNYRFNAALGNYNSQIAGIQNELASRQTGSNVRSTGQYVGVHSQVLQDRLKALQTMRAEYIKRAKEILNPRKISEDVEKEIATGNGGKTGGGRSSVTTPKVEEILPVGSVAALNKELSELRKQQELATSTEKWDEYQAKIDSVTSRMKVLKGEIPDPSKIQQGNGVSVLGIGIGESELKDVQQQIDKITGSEGGVKIPAKLDLKVGGGIGNIADTGKETADSWKSAANAIQSVGSAMQSIEDPSAKIAGIVAQAIATVAMAYAQALSTDWSSKSSIWTFIAAAAASTASMITTIASIHSATGFENGGEIKGNSYSGDNIPIMANAGEVVLTRAMAGNIASQLQGSGNNVHVTGELRGESIFLAVNRSLKRRGKGELVTWG